MNFARELPHVHTFAFEIVHQRICTRGHQTHLNIIYYTMYYTIYRTHAPVDFLKTNILLNQHEIINSKSFSK